MRKKLLPLILLIFLFLCGFIQFGKSSNFEIQFIDVGQGDSALVECDGHCMLIDGGGKNHGKNVQDVLTSKQIQHLDILAVSHFHEDHYAGFIKALENVNKIDLVISNSDDYKNGIGIDENSEEEDERKERKTFDEFEAALRGSKVKKIKVPSVGSKYELGSATVEVVDNSCSQDNDSLVLLITYGKTKFLFTGDIEYNAQKRIYEKYQDKDGVDKGFKIDLMKMPHHGAYSGSLQGFLRTFMPDYVVFSVGQENSYHHPKEKTLELISDKKGGFHPTILRTDQDGNITVKSDGKKLTILKSKN